MIVLTYRQEKFVQGVVKGMTQADSYRAAYNTGNMKQDSIHQLASKLMANAKVASRAAELRAPVAARVDMSVHAHVSRLAQIRDAAMEAGDYGPAGRCEIAIGQVAGHYVQKVEVQQSAFASMTLQEREDMRVYLQGELAKRKTLEPDISDVVPK